MSCYLRHLTAVLREAGLEVTPSNRRRIDQAIHEIVEADYKDCPVTWKKLKLEIVIDEEKRHIFVADLKKALSKPADPRTEGGDQ